MKNIISVFFLMFCSFLLITGQNVRSKEIKTEIGSVTVYLNGAEVKRSKTVKLSPGKTQLVFSDLSPKLNAGSIRITTGSDIDLLGITSKINYLSEEKNKPRIKQLKDSVKIITESIQKITDLSDAYKTEKKMLLSNISIGGNEKGVSIADLKIASDFYRSRISEINAALSKFNSQRKVLLQKQQKIRKQLSELNASSNYSRAEISVLISANTSTSSEIELKYLITAAGWSPSYDIKAEDTDKPVKLEYRAKVYNNTDIDWKNVKIKLSTADPNTGVSKPELKPWYLKYKTYSYNNSARFKKGEGYIQNKMIQAQNMPSVSQDDADVSYEYEEIDVSLEEDDGISDIFTDAQVPELSAEFDIKKTYDIPSDDKPYIVDINEFELPASYKHYAVTKLDKDVFLLARITGWQDLNLIEGPANVYYAGTYLGQSFIDIRNVKDTLDLSLGRDGKVLVTRTKLKTYSSSKIIGTKRKETMAYEIIARNNRKSDINLQILDQIPISQTDEIEVKVLDISGADFNETSGKLTWELSLKPGETKKIILSFEIKYPKNKEIQIEKRKSMQIRYF